MNKQRFLDVLINQGPKRLGEHIVIVLIVLLISLLISIPLGILLSRDKFKNSVQYILNFLNIFQTIPSFALIAIALPVLGIGTKPAIVVLVLQSILPIVRNTIVGILEVNPSMLEAAKGMGMSSKQILKEVELPLAMPLIWSGIRMSATLVVSSATLAGFIGSGGLGIIISNGLNMFWKEFIIVGAGLGAILAITIDKTLFKIEQKLLPWADKN